MGDFDDEPDIANNENDHLQLEQEKVTNYGLTDQNQNREGKEDGCIEKSVAVLPGIKEGVKRFMAARPYWVEPAFMFFQLSVWSLVPLANQFIYERLKIQFYEDSANITRDEIVENLYTVQEDASNWVLYLELMRSIPSVFTTLVILSYGDITGRKLGLGLPCIGGSLKALVYLIVSIYSLDLNYLVIGHLLEGLCGTQLTMAGSAYAYVADITPKERRTFRYILLNTFLLIGITIGNIACGFIIDSFGYTSAFIYTMVVFLFAGFYILVLVPESLQITEVKKENSVLQIMKETLRSFTIYLKKRPGHFTRTRLIVCLVILMLTALTLMGLVNVETLYLVGWPFSFSSVKLAFFLAEGAILNAIGPLLAVLLLQKHVSDIFIGILGSLSAIVGFTLLGVAYNDVMIFLVPVFTCFMASILPISRAMMSNMVDQDEQGALQASISTLNTINDVLGIAVHVGIYTATLRIFRGLIFLLTAGMFVIVLFLFLLLLWFDKKYPSQDSTVQDISQMKVKLLDSGQESAASGRSASP